MCVGCDVICYSRSLCSTALESDRRKPTIIYENHQYIDMYTSSYFCMSPITLAASAILVHISYIKHKTKPNINHANNDATTLPLTTRD